MRVTPEDYAVIREAITDMPKDASERERWDAMWRAVDADRLEFMVLSPYNDSHIDTALRRMSHDT